MAKLMVILFPLVAFGWSAIVTNASIHTWSSSGFAVPCRCVTPGKNTCLLTLHVKVV